MDHKNTDWNERYLTKDTPWDTDVFSSEIEKRYKEWQLNPQKYPRLLDIGCGTGTNAIEFAKRGFQVTGCDISTDAIRQAKEKSQKAKIEVQWLQADFFKHDWRVPPFPLLVDRGCYHILRQININRYLTVMDQLTHKGSLFFVLTGNANSKEEMGPPKVSAEEMCRELGQVFQLKDLREFMFDGVSFQGAALAPIGWSAVWEKPGN